MQPYTQAYTHVHKKNWKNFNTHNNLCELRNNFELSQKVKILNYFIYENPRKFNLIYSDTEVICVSLKTWQQSQENKIAKDMRILWRVVASWLHSYSKLNILYFKICAVSNMSLAPEYRSLWVFLRGETNGSIVKAPHPTLFNTFCILGLCRVGYQIQDFLHSKHVKLLKISVKSTVFFPNVMLPVLSNKRQSKSPLLGTDSQTPAVITRHTRQTTDKPETVSLGQMEDTGREVEN